MGMEPEMTELWKGYAAGRDPAIRERLIVEYSHLIKYVAGRLNIYFASTVEFDDLVGYGVFGLIDAIEKYDLAKGVKFETYASLRIRGAIIDNVRNLDWVPRSLRQKGKDLEKAYSELEAELGRAATEEEACERLGVTKEHLGKLVGEVSFASMVSLEEYLEQHFEIEPMTGQVDRDSDPELSAEAEETKAILADAVDRLPDKEKTVVSLYYYDEMTLKEISKVMGVSESRVSQLHTKAIVRIRETLQEADVH
ncbi:MAG: FliA/WhiG family RNA polymerase sigma factor [Oscillospiraceae bacterium]|nr:FliA/WhiG family RNA polymerase sigma factor [Oscillospiraceae bacterium]